ncbi:hypothetical protein NA78x_006285 [Anatilimnocola sp. NA78]|uniref:hypothetical protein n=1 Tax=Anatilimnocola sp. NA78 TaxID=3415683 RepID=UPI003CE5A9C4
MSEPIPTTRRLPRVSLRWLLVLVAIVPLGVGLLVRAQREKVWGYELRQANLGVSATQITDAHMVYAAWRIRASGREELVYLLVIPSGDSVLGTTGMEFIHASAVSAEINRGIWIRPDCLYSDCRSLSNHQYPTVWLYRVSDNALKHHNEEKIVDQVKGISPGDLRFSRDDFANFSKSQLWLNKLKPLATAESERFYTGPGKK